MLRFTGIAPEPLVLDLKEDLAPVAKIDSYKGYVLWSKEERW